MKFSVVSFIRKNEKLIFATLLVLAISLTTLLEVTSGLNFVFLFLIGVVVGISLKGDKSSVIVVGIVSFFSYFSSLLFIHKNLSFFECFFWS
jgi:hypothetical protein